MLITNAYILRLGRKHSLIILGVVIGVFAALHSGNLGTVENYDIMKFYHEYYLDSCSLDQMPELRAPLKLYTLCLSEKIFHDTRIIPFVFTIGLFPITWLLSLRLFKSYFVANVSSSLLLCSKIIGLLGTTGSFSSDWVFFFLGSIYLMYRLPLASGPLLFASLASKGLPMLMLPVLLYRNFHDHTIPKRARILNLTSIGAVSGIVVSLWLSGNMQFLQPDGFDFSISKLNLYSMVYVFRHDVLVFPILALGFTGFWITRKKRESLIMLVSSAWFYLLVPLLPVFTIYSMYDYRMIPLIVFASMGAGVFFNQTLKAWVLNRIIGKKSLG